MALRETAPPLRERGAGAVRASWTGRDWLRAALIALAVGVFLAVSGAFGSEAMPPVLRLVYWTGGLLGGVAVARGVFGLLAKLPPLRDDLMKLRVAGTLAMAAIYTFVVWGLNRAIAPEAYRLPLIGLFPVVLMISAAMTALNVLAERRAAPPAPAASPAPPRFLERLPLPLRAAELYAVEAEDHYLRVRTSKGSELVLCRMADAVAELEGVEGLRIHRSWWVAKAAVAKVARGDGRAVLTLKDGTKAPVSRGAMAALKEAGWV